MSKKEKINFVPIIRDFLEAEASKDFDRIFSFFSVKLSRFYESYNPNYSELRNTYNHSWAHVSTSINQIKSIAKITEYTYDLKTNSKLIYHKKGTEFTVNSTTRFI